MTDILTSPYTDTEK